MSDDAEKQFDPTPQHRQRAAEAGCVPRSRDLSGALLLLVGMLMFWQFAPGWAEAGALWMQQTFQQAAWLTADEEAMISHLQGVGSTVAVAVLPGLLGLCGVAIGLECLLTGFRFQAEKLTPDWSRPFSGEGLTRLFSWETSWRGLAGLMKTVLVTTAAGIYVVGKWDMLGGLSQLSLTQWVQGVLVLVSGASLSAVCALVAWGVADYGYHWWQNEQRLKMTDEELRADHKDTQGNPQQRRQRRQLAQALATHRLPQALASAQAIVAAGTSLAIVLHYNAAADSAPIVSAKVHGTQAAHLLQQAARLNIPISQMPSLATSLDHQAQLMQPIPPQLFDAVAQIMPANKS